MKFPIARPSKKQENEMVRLVWNVLAHQSKISGNMIDELAFKIYKLSEIETKFFISK